MNTPPHPSSDMKVIHGMLVELGRTQKRIETRLCRLMNQNGLDEFGTPIPKFIGSLITTHGQRDLYSPNDDALAKQLWNEYKRP